MTDLIWRDEQDDNDLTEWSAASIYHDDGDAFMFRIKEKLIGNGPTVTYHETSDAELMLQPPRTWDSLQAAKDALQAEHLAMVAAECEPEGVTYSGDNYPGHPHHIPTEAYALSLQVNTSSGDWLKQMFSGDMPEVGATYGYRVCSVTDANGVTTVEMRFVRL